MVDGDPIPRTDEAAIMAQVRDELRTVNERAERPSETAELLGQVRDELRKINDRAERDRGAGELREPAKPAAKRAVKKPAGESRRRDSKT